MYSISLLTTVVVNHHLLSWNMSINGSPLKTINIAPPGGQFGAEQHREDNSQPSENYSHTATGKNSLGNKPINIICRMGIVTHLHSRHFEALCSFISILHSTWHTVGNQPPAQAKHIRVVGHSGMDMTSTEVVVVGLQYSAHHRFQQKGCHLKVLQQYLQNRRKTIQSIGQHLLPLILHLHLILAHLGDPNKPPKEQVPASCRTLENRHHSSWRRAFIAENFIRQSWCRQFEWPFDLLGWYRTQTANQPGANRILLDTIWQLDGAGQLQCVQQVEESMGGWVSAEEALAHYLRAAQFETGLRWSPALGDGGCRLFGDNPELAAIG